MAIHTRENLYRGVNAHLHSYLQQEGDWSVFHGEHITHLREALQTLLPIETGYVVLAEKSLQYLRDDLVTSDITAARTVVDIGVYRPFLSGEDVRAQVVTTPGATVSLVQTLIHPENVRAVVVYQLDSQSRFGKPVTRIELLSPANKPPGSHYGSYLEKREETLISGINLVEVDYLHQRRFPLKIVPSYPARQPQAYPYVIAVSSPHPSLEQGQTAFYGFRVDDPIPPIAIPLLGDDRVILDLNAVYNHTFAANTAYGMLIVDYAELPPGFDTYDTIDQQRIQARMAAAAQLVSQPMPPTQE
jgi:hypothetical protein